MSRLSKQLLPRHTINILRSLRHYAYLALLPLDYLSRVINGKSDFPPLHLRRYVGPLRTFEASGTDPNFRFEYIDVKNLAFNPKGAQSAEDYAFPFEAHSFDVILLKSIFTHMRPLEVENYIGEVSRLLKSGGRCLVTFFLLNEEQARLVAEGRQKLQFNFGEGVWRYVYEHRAESAVAYEESHIRSVLDKCGLNLAEPTYYGSWTGRRDGLSFQDMLMLRKD